MNNAKNGHLPAAFTDNLYKSYKSLTWKRGRVKDELIGP